MSAREDLIETRITLLRRRITDIEALIGSGGAGGSGTFDLDDGVYTGGALPSGTFALDEGVYVP